MGRTGVAPKLALAAFLVLPSAAAAEVMDKEPSLPRIWAVALALGFAGLLAWSRHVVLGVIVTLIAVVPALAVHAELVDPYVGPAIVHEAGRSYVVQAYLAMLVCAALHLAGIAWFVRRRRFGPGAGSLKHRATEQ